MEVLSKIKDGKGYNPVVRDIRDRTKSNDMALSKASKFSEEDQFTSMYARAFAHPARLGIMRKLRQEGPCMVAEMMKGSPISLPAMSQHLLILRKMELVEWHEMYPHIVYNLHEENFARALRYLKRIEED